MWLEADADSGRFGLNFYQLTCYIYIRICMHTCVHLVQKILPLPLFILTCGISNSKRFISKRGRSNTVVWIVRLQPVRKESGPQRSPVAPKALGSGVLRKHARTTGTSALPVGCAEAGVSENPICLCSSIQQKPKAVQPFFFRFSCPHSGKPTAAWWARWFVGSPTRFVGGTATQAA